MAAPKQRQRVVGGQLVYDAPRTCSLCGDRFRRRALVQTWQRTRKIVRGKVVWQRLTIRLCIERVGQYDDKLIGCHALGLAGLFRKRGGA